MSDDLGPVMRQIGARAAQLVAADREAGFPGPFENDAVLRAVNLIGGLPPPDAADSIHRQSGFTLLAIAEYLEAEAERRAVWEKRIEERLEFLLPAASMERFRSDNPKAPSFITYDRVNRNHFVPGKL